MEPIDISNSPTAAYFQQPPPKNRWGNFHSPEEDLTKPISELPPDMIIRDPNEGSWQTTAFRIADWAASTVILPLGASQLTRYFIQRASLLPIYPAQSRIASIFFKEFTNISIDEERKRVFQEAKERWRFEIIRRIVIQDKGGQRYDGVLFSPSSTTEQWALQATGNAVPIEHAVEICATCYGLEGKQQMGILMINNPGVGRSEGQATPESMGDAQRAGLLFLEEVVKAKKILIAAHSLGGMAISQAIFKHSFKKEIQYAAAFMLTFARIENLAARSIGYSSASSILRWAGVQSDVSAACKKMVEIGSRVYVFQASKNKEEDSTFEIKRPEEFDDFVTDGPFKNSEDIESGQGPILKEEGLAYVLGKEALEGQPLDPRIQLIGVGQTYHTDIREILERIQNGLELWESPKEM